MNLFGFVNLLIQIRTSEQIHKSFDSDQDFRVQLANLFFRFPFFLKQYKN